MTGFCGGGDSDDDGLDSMREAIARLTRERDAAIRKAERELTRELAESRDVNAHWHAKTLELVEALRPFIEPKAAQHWNVHCDKARALVEKYGATASPSPPHPAANTSAEGDD